MTIEEILKKENTFIYKTRGRSMEPLLAEDHGLVKIKAKDPARRCKENDVVLYKYPGRKNYVLHRIVEVLPDSYVMLGDNCISYERGIKDENIIGVMTAFVQDGVEKSVDDPEYLDYVRKLRAGEKKRVALKKHALKFKRALKKTVFYDKWKKYIGR